MKPGNGVNLKGKKLTKTTTKPLGLALGKSYRTKRRLAGRSQVAAKSTGLKQPARKVTTTVKKPGQSVLKRRPLAPRRPQPQPRGLGLNNPMEKRKRLGLV
jgi:hypothetical protein